MTAENQHTPSIERKLRVFLAEDNSADVYLVEMALQEHGLEFQLMRAADGEQALSAVIAFAQGKCPDIALLDRNLPRHDGDKVMEAIRQHAHCSKIPIVIMSSAVSIKDRETADRFGAVYFRKATSLAEFMELGALVKHLCTHTEPLL